MANTHRAELLTILPGLIKPLCYLARTFYPPKTWATRSRPVTFADPKDEPTCPKCLDKEKTK